ncbi:hypothetical protein OUZ56_028638 [Daphnia magna]|uniref:Uncharacterized protein n=1 Tax=Daphnia magna TaxID=35525 RepID=A0ABR0B4K1_9CRUS|nr:hypothetical protein OUZ56_028638 [Daphnia magna]
MSANILSSSVELRTSLLLRKYDNVLSSAVSFHILVKVDDCNGMEKRNEVTANIAIHEVSNPGSLSFHAAALPLSYG